MIIAGDVAVAYGDRISFDGFPESLLHKPWCINLEGAITSGHEDELWGTYNWNKWMESFQLFSIDSVFTANNHIHDIPDGISITEQWLSENNLSVVGTGRNQEAALRPACCDEMGIRYKIVGFGWPVIGCVPAKADSPGVNIFEARTVRKQIENLMAAEDTQRVIVLIHGNYEFEVYPQPAHRQLALELIDAGVHAVIFHHPHIVGPVERYKGRLIAYSLGNWAFSYGKFFGGKLRFPESSFHQIAVDMGSADPVVHHATFSPPSQVTYDFSEQLSSANFTLKPEFEGYSNSDYIQWFKKHRVKRRGLPIYRDPDARFTNAVRDCWVGIRQVVIDSAAKAGLKRMRRGQS